MPNVLPPTFPTAQAGINGYLSKGSIGSCPATVTYTGIGNVIGDIGGLGVSSKLVDITPHGPNTWVCMFPTVKTFGPVTFDVSFIPISPGDGGLGAVSGLLADADSQALRAFMYTWPDGTQWFWEAYVGDMMVKGQANGIQQGTVKLTSFGPPTLN